MNYSKALQTCLDLQDKMNSTVNPDWIKADYPFSLAALVELGEYAEHIGFKWWKKQTPDYDQAFIEVVDMLHFILSDVIISIKAGDNMSFDEIVSVLETYDDVSQEQIVGSKLYLVSMTYASISTSDDYTNIVGFLVDLANVCGKTKKDLLGTYIAKNTLNIFRQKHGYKNGTYVKQWFGEEDNVTLWKLISENPELLTDVVMLEDKLEAVYREVLNAKD